MKEIQIWKQMNPDTKESNTDEWTEFSICKFQPAGPTATERTSWDSFENWNLMRMKLAVDIETLLGVGVLKRRVFTRNTRPRITSTDGETWNMKTRMKFLPSSSVVCANYLIMFYIYLESFYLVARYHDYTIQASMDLPADKAKLLKQYDNEKKWDIICDEIVVQSCSTCDNTVQCVMYDSENGMLWYLIYKWVPYPSNMAFCYARRMLVMWVKEFLNDDNHGLDSLIEYLSFRLVMMRHEYRIADSKHLSEETLNTSSDGLYMIHMRNTRNLIVLLQYRLHNTLTIIKPPYRWVKEFLNDDNHGLDSLIEYLSFRLVMMRHEYRIADSKHLSEETLNTSSGLPASTNPPANVISPQSLGHQRPSLDLASSPSVKKRSRHAARLNMGDPKDDIHVCILCLRAIMNNKYGLNMVIKHTEAINSIALSLMHKSLRTKALVLELLAAICLVTGGHEIILAAFDNFKEICQESKRFETLMDYFMNYEVFHIEFMVACMQFINIVVHSVEDMNFRVHLQYEFSRLGLDSYLDKLRHTESEELQVQISAYLDNVFDVAALMEDSETKTAALEKVAELEDELGH
ncbi:formin-like protein, partial [Diaphorina citri]|uniref:Formin-like protein n=1 Tax=Diaphorina citri TaxID=121845 RepID=A0A3Q0J2J7_DIACI